VSVRGAHEYGVGLPRKVHIIDEAALPAQQARVLETQHRLADSILAHEALSRERSN
jgi:hypothetical protein